MHSVPLPPHPWNNRNNPSCPTDYNLWPICIYDATQLNPTASKQRQLCAQQRDVTMLMTSLHCHPVATMSWVELRRVCESVFRRRVIVLINGYRTVCRWRPVSARTVWITVDSRPSSWLPVLTTCRWFNCCCTSEHHAEQLTAHWLAPRSWAT